MCTELMEKCETCINITQLPDIKHYSERCLGHQKKCWSEWEQKLHLKQSTFVNVLNYFSSFFISHYVHTFKSLGRMSVC